MARSGIIITDRWCDKPRSTPGKIMLFPREDRCPKEHRYLALAWDPRADPTKSGNRRGRYESATFATSAEANTWATSRRAQFIQGTSSATKAIWEEVGKEFLTSLKLRTERPITERYLAQMKQMIDAVTGLGVKDISQQNFPSIIERWLYSLTSKKNWQKKARPASAGHKRKMLILARVITRFAKKRRLIAFDALESVNIGKPPERQKELFSGNDILKLIDPARRFPRAALYQQTVSLVEERGSLAAAAQSLGCSISTIHYRLKHPPVEDPWWLVAVLLFYFGLRHLTILSLTPAMIDLSARVLRLPADIRGNKLRRAARIPIQTEIYSLLENIVTTLGPASQVPLVGPDLAEMLEANLTNGFKDYCRRCGVDAKGPHTARHSFCSVMAALGVNHFVVMELVGHKDAQVSKNYAQGAQEYVDFVRNWPRTNPPELFFLRSLTNPALRFDPASNLE